MFGKIIYWNQAKGYGFISRTVQASPTERPFQESYFFHWSQFTKHEVPIIGAFVVFTLGEPFTAGKKVQAVGVRFATAEEIATHITTSQAAGIDALKAAVTGSAK